jgi:raffinose/stachyose/melibiose transport system substrate-binding protein
MKRKLLLLVLALVVVFALAACGTDDGAGTNVDGGNVIDRTDNTEDGVIELTVLNYFSRAAIGSADELVEIWDAFNDAHPGIRIVNRIDEYEDPFHVATEAMAAAGTLPDVIFGWPTGRSTTLHDNNLLMDLSALAARDGLANYFIPQALDPALQPGGILAIIPQGITASHAMYVNVALLDSLGLQPATTYAELVAQAPVLRAAGFDTILMPNQPTWVMQSCLFSMIAGRFMGDNWDQRILAGETNFLDPNFIAALNFVQQMYDDGVISRTTLMIDYGEGPEDFAMGEAAYYIDGDWRVGDLRNLIPIEDQADFAVTVFPEIDGVQFNRSNTSVLATGWGINANIDEAKLEAAWTLVKWLTGREVQEFRIRNGVFATPTRTDIDFEALAEVLQPLQLQMANFGDHFDRATVVIDGSFAGPVFTPLNDGLRAIGMGDQTPEQVAQAVQAAFEHWVEFGEVEDEDDDEEDNGEGYDADNSDDHDHEDDEDCDE